MHRVWLMPLLEFSHDLSFFAKAQMAWGTNFSANVQILQVRVPQALLVLSLFAEHVPEGHILEGLLCQVQVVLDDFLLSLQSLSCRERAAETTPSTES